MPTYRYRNIQTGEEWEEIRKVDERLDGVDGVSVEMVLSTPRLRDYTLLHHKGQDFYDKVIQPKKAAFPTLK